MLSNRNTGCVLFAVETIDLQCCFKLKKHFFPVIFLEKSVKYTVNKY